MKNLLTALQRTPEIVTMVSNAGLEGIGDIFRQAGLISDHEEWWVREIPVHFIAEGKVIEFEPLGFNGADWKVRLRMVDPARN